ncbi:glycine cleavage system H protein, mitochondrial [Venturia canescens]|uniref:glycine cleavage system H protein, mitochondrial n=1 Tax=Venturia canescens TaxID=32260 RepID=UPI001C9D55BE|nr:glycine cleavage system H protein, mitochondrial [Venturia canescens]
MAQIVTQVLRTSIRTIANTGNSKILNIGGTGTAKSSVFHFRSIGTTPVTRVAERWYTSSHEWIEVKDKVGTVGISDYAQDALGDVVFAQLPEVGASIEKDDECGALESVKAASEIASPVSGKVVESNEALSKKPGLVNSSCYEEGWLFKLELKNPEEIKSLMDEKSYKEYLKSDPH